MEVPLYSLYRFRKESNRSEYVGELSTCTHLILVPPILSLLFHPSHVPDAFLYQKHEQYTSILKLNRKGVFYGTEESHC